MNKFTTVGLVIVAIGSYVATLSQLRALGFAVVAVGSLIVVIGQRRDAQADSEKLEEKISDIKSEIASAMHAADSTEVTERLDSIGNEFSEWAAHFVKHRENAQLEAAQSRIAAKQVYLDNSDAWRPVLEMFLDTVERLVNAYRAEIGEPQLAKIPPLPRNLFGDEMPYYAQVEFSPTTMWQIEINRGRGPRWFDLPDLFVNLRLPTGGCTKIAHVWSIDPDVRFVVLALDGDTLPKLPGLEASFSPKNWRQDFPRAIQRLVESQLSIQ